MAAKKPGSPAPSTSASDKVHVFISYSKEDWEIASALYEQLTQVDPHRVVCFMDSKTIESGNDWQEELERALRQADWLVCVYTGELSEYCGFEVGVFVEANKLGPRAKKKDARIVTLHSVSQLPPHLSPYQSRLVVSQGTTHGPERDDAFYLATPLAKFLGDFYAYKSLYVPKDTADSARILQKLGSQVRLISEAFDRAHLREEMHSTTIQLGIEVRVPRPENDEIAAIPAHAEVSGTYGSMKLFDLLPPSTNERMPRTTWSELRAACASDFQPEVQWMEKLERDMLQVARFRAVGSAEATFKSAEKVYRAILSRHVKYYNGSHLFSILFVETLPRQFLGKKNTSMLLAGIVLASRFRFSYLENKEEVFKSRFGDRLSHDEFETSCRQLKYDIEQMAHEAADFGLLNPATFIQAFGAENQAQAESFLTHWDETEKLLFAELPKGSARVTSENRAKVKEAVRRFLDALEPENDKFIMTAIDVFRSEIASSLRRPVVEH